MRETPIVYFKTNKKNVQLWGIIAKPNSIFISIIVEITFFRQDLPMENLTDSAVLISKITWIRRIQTSVVKSFACDCFFKLLSWISSQGHKRSEGPETPAAAGHTGTGGVFIRRTERVLQLT